MIYQIDDLVNDKFIFYVVDETTQSEGEALNIPNSIWNIGTETDANLQLSISQQSYLLQCSDRFTVCHAILNENGDQVWKFCDLTQEQENTDQIYQIFNVIVAEHTEVIGLSNAKAELERVKQEFLNWSGLGSLITLNSLPLPIKNKTTGTQTI